MSSNGITVVSVLKSGGEYTPEYANKLMKQIPEEFDKLCLTDFSAEHFDCPVEQLQHNYQGWWSKLELFSLVGKFLFFDLDTFILGDLSTVKKVLERRSFYMLRPFRKTEKWASGVMAWNGDLQKISEGFCSGDVWQYRWDQRYISAKVAQNQIKVKPIQDFLDVKSYKHHGIEEPPECDILCFHGKPRPHESTGWAKEYWESL